MTLPVAVQYYDLCSLLDARLEAGFQGAGTIVSPSTTALLCKLIS